MNPQTREYKAVALTLHGPDYGQAVIVRATPIVEPGSDPGPDQSLGIGRPRPATLFIDDKPAYMVDLIDWFQETPHKRLSATFDPEGFGVAVAEARFTSGNG